MIMTDFEIRRAYREARNPRQQLKILAELNMCTVRDIFAIVTDRTVEKRSRDIELEERRRLYDEGYSDAMIAKLTGISIAAVCAWRKKNCLKSNTQHIADYRKIEDMYKDGCTDREIADQLGCTPSYVSTWRWRKGLPVNKKEK